MESTTSNGQDYAVPTETEAFVESLRPVTSVKLLDGKDYPIPKINLGTDVKLLKLLESVVQELQRLGIFDGKRRESMSEEEIGRSILGILFSTAPDKVVEAAAAIMRQKKEWVEENLDGMDQAVEVVFPFLRDRLNRIGSKLGKLMSLIPNSLSIGSQPS